jgi:hypothetical protein
MAGHTSKLVSTSFTATVTPSSLQTLINRFCTDLSVAASLDQDAASIAHADHSRSAPSRPLVRSAPTAIDDSAGALEFERGTHAASLCRQ